MKKPRITEGEWTHHSNDVTDEDYDTIAVAHSMRDRADARAISAVPEMIDALMDVAHSIENARLNNGGIALGDNCEKKVIKALKKAGVQQ